MEISSAAAQRPNLLDIGSVFSRALAVFGRNPLLYVIPLLVARLPDFVSPFYVAEGGGASLAIGVASSILCLVVEGIVCFGVYRSLAGSKASFRECWSRASGRAGALFAVSLLTGVAVVFGLVLLIVPGVVIVCMIAVAVPACVIERRDAREAIQRSRELTKGARWQIFALLFTGYLALVLVFMGISFSLEAFAGIGKPVAQLAGNILAIVPEAFVYVMTAIIYFDLRMVKEGIALESLVRVFD